MLAPDESRALFIKLGTGIAIFAWDQDLVIGTKFLINQLNIQGASEFVYIFFIKFSITSPQNMNLTLTNVRIGKRAFYNLSETETGTSILQQGSAET